MLSTWSKNIARNFEIVQNSQGPGLLLVVAGDSESVSYWHRQMRKTSRDTLRMDGSAVVQPVLEGVPLGNFLGTLNAWSFLASEHQSLLDNLPPVSLMSMSFGSGKRLSPFTQALGNRKSAFLTPLRGTVSGVFLSTADLSNLYSNLWIEKLTESGFRGVIVKWGDEAVVPGLDWTEIREDYSQLDALRFVWKTGITESLARDKDWVLVDRRTGLMNWQYSRQEPTYLKSRLAASDASDSEPAVNLGSLAVSYEFLRAALEVFGPELGRSDRSVDWDPYVWMALMCRDESLWKAEKEQERHEGRTGIRDLEEKYPDFFPHVLEFRQLLESRTGRRLAVGTVDFGEPLWVDLGLHQSLRSCIASLPSDSLRAEALRRLFGLPNKRDAQGNIIINSEIAKGANIEESVIVNSTVSDSSSVVRRGVLIGSSVQRVQMPRGGSLLFCAADDATLEGENAMAFRSVCKEMTLPDGGRHSTLMLPSGPENMLSNESVIDYAGDNYTKPILGNRISFEEAASQVSRVGAVEMDERWQSLWNSRIAEQESD